MNLGQIVHLNDPKDFWVIIERYKKTCKGIVKTKLFKKLQLGNRIPEFKPYTKARMSYATVVKPSDMDKVMYAEYVKLSQANFVEWEPDK